MSEHRATIAILAGGQSRRMGVDKSFVLLNGKPLLQHVIDRARTLDQPMILIANAVERFQVFGLPVYPDVIPGSGSLGGLYTALTHSTTPYTLCLACDMPRIEPALLRHLLTLTESGADAIIPRANGVMQGLHAVYHQRCLPVIAEQIAQDDLRVGTLSALVTTRFVDAAELRPFDPHGRSFINLNTPAEVAACDEA